MQPKQKVVFVGLSGGVDSSVAAARLIEQGYFVVGVFIKVWQPDFLPCSWEQERLDAMRVAAKLNIPFLTCDAQEEYKRDVAEYFIEAYKNGRTPNPDVMCNKHVKFGAFLRFAKAHGADYVATGHYAQVQKSEAGYRLLRGIDQSKDQSYFLWTLTQEQLAMTLLPIGDTEKGDIRTEASSHGLLTASKKDSQGICFLGHVDIAEFLSHYVALKEGRVVDTQGNEVGRHRGALVYTIGQRHGFILTSKDSERKPYYIVARDIERNVLTVSQTKPETHVDDTLILEDLNYIAWKPEVGEVVMIETRYRQKPTPATVREVTANTLKLSYSQTTEAVSDGQSCVIYRDTVCLGGGIIRA